MSSSFDHFGDIPKEPFNGIPKDHFGDIPKEPFNDIPKEPKATNPPVPFAEPQRGIMDMLTDSAVGAGETALQIATGAVAAPVGNLIGLGAMGLNAINRRWGSETPDTLSQNIKEAGTYQPKTPVGKIISDAVSMPARGWQMMGDTLQDVAQGQHPEAGSLRDIRARTLGAMVSELPGIVGVMGAPKVVHPKQAALSLEEGLAKPRNDLRDSFRAEGLPVPTQADALSVTPQLQSKYNQLVKRDVNIPENTPITPESLGVIKKEANKAYDRVVLGGNTRGVVTPPSGNIPLDFIDGAPVTAATKVAPKTGFQPDDKFKENLQSKVDFLKTLMRTPGKPMGGLADVIHELRENLKSTDTIDPSGLLKKIQDLRDKSTYRGEAATHSRETAKAYRFLSQQYESLIERQLSKGDVEAFKDARKTLAKLHILNKGGMISGYGDIDYEALANVKGRGLDGGMKLVADHVNHVVKGKGNAPRSKADIIRSIFRTVAHASGHHIIGRGLTALHDMAPQGQKLETVRPNYQLPLKQPISPPAIAGMMMSNPPPPER